MPRWGRQSANERSGNDDAGEREDDGFRRIDGTAACARTEVAVRDQLRAEGRRARWVLTQVVGQEEAWAARRNRNVVLEAEALAARSEREKRK